MRPTVVRRTAASACAVLLTAGLTGCSVPGFGGPDADSAMDTLAKAMASGDLGAVDFTGGRAGAKQAASAYDDLTRGIRGDSEAKVSVGRVSTDGDSATGQLDWSWQVGPKTWSYDTTVRLSKGSTPDGDAWLVKWQPTIVEPSLEDGERLVETTVRGERGPILGSRDQPLVTPRPVRHVGLDKTGLTAAQATDSAERLATLLDIDAKDFLKRVKASGPKAFVEGIVYREQDAPAAVMGALSDIKGAGVVSGTLPLAPSKDFAAAILGTVGPATAELVKDSKGRIKAGDEVGLSGLQKRYDEQLSGTRGATVVALDEKSQRRTLFTADAQAGRPLHTTLDLKTQNAAQRALANVGPASALVAIRPSTGDLVAIASGPGSKGYNTATYGQYAPGSTFKVVSALALLRAGLTPQSRVECPPTTVVDGKRFKNYDDYPSSGFGSITFEDALANSCNTAFIGQRGKLGQTSLADAAAALGFGVDHDTGFPTFFGKVGPPASETQAAASMIGQGTVLASPMAMATVVASVLKGSAVLPRLLPDVEVQSTQPAKPLTAEEAGQLRTMMRAVVERGSGVALKDLPGGPVIAKTGTAEFGDKPPLPTHAWMVAGRDDLAVAVFVERGASGSGTAGPVLEQFLREVR
ncbi:penicillin-binding transpeptidase domain-containing protein [Marmoricola sp. URHB0036]|uniref:penicillin-binding transpeptidase domain-containing protein n=1 Tax=Marmoricola sp. URHB0036 TaxID=1298863 RepID=UPI000483548D|nr:penicillin-binding transpeptidase domain-containing protein [Marmoricola sp. URHB0036]